MWSLVLTTPETMSAEFGKLGEPAGTYDAPRGTPSRATPAVDDVNVAAPPPYVAASSMNVGVAPPDLTCRKRAPFGSPRFDGTNANVSPVLPRIGSAPVVCEDSPGPN